MRANSASTGSDYYQQVGNLRTGARAVTNLLNGTEGAKDNFKLGYSEGQDGEDWTSPRHHHLFEQVRYVLEGEYMIANRTVLPAGWVGYFPESAYYGPQVKSANLKMMTLQYGGPSGLGFYSLAQRREAMNQLKQTGVVENGVYSWTDENGKTRNQDAGEAVWEKAFGGPVEYPRSRYRDIMMINPSAFAWRDDPDRPGVRRKHLGTFSEREVKIALIAMEAGSILELGTEPATEILFLKDGALRHGADAWGQLTGFTTSADEGSEDLEALEPSELLYVKLPTFVMP